MDNLFNGFIYENEGPYTFVIFRLVNPTPTHTTGIRINLGFKMEDTKQRTSDELLKIVPRVNYDFALRKATEAVFNKPHIVKISAAHALIEGWHYELRLSNGKSEKIFPYGDTELIHYWIKDRSGSYREGVYDTRDLLKIQNQIGGIRG